MGVVFAEALLESGANVGIADIDPKLLSKARSKFSKYDRQVAMLKLDITKPESVQSCLRNFLEKFGRIDGLVNNAVLRAPVSDFLKRDLDDFKKTTDVNINGVFLITQKTLEIMKKQRSGCVINIASIYGVVGPDQSIYPDDKINCPEYYCFQKGGLINFTRYLATTFGRYGVRANTITPGGIYAGQDKKFVENYSKKTPLGRMAKTGDICGALIFLMSDASSYVTGHNLIVDGGWTAL
ncbi:MAG: short-chain dehydrogenase/reductase SDR [Parcubacteria group bacterium Licking1014_17]|nr:MAG: short-chain dehydrogenase/reductase SDR [Parcubacteria group bacterium Licking1014_17]